MAKIKKKIRKLNIGVEVLQEFYLKEEKIDQINYEDEIEYLNPKTSEGGGGGGDTPSTGGFITLTSGYTNNGTDFYTEGLTIDLKTNIYPNAWDGLYSMVDKDLTVYISTNELHMFQLYGNVNPNFSDYTSEGAFSGIYCYQNGFPEHKADLYFCQVEEHGNNRYDLLITPKGSDIHEEFQLHNRNNLSVDWAIYLGTCAVIAGAYASNDLIKIRYVMDTGSLTSYIQNNTTDDKATTDTAGSVVKTPHSRTVQNPNVASYTFYTPSLYYATEDAEGRIPVINRKGEKLNTSPGVVRNTGIMPYLLTGGVQEWEEWDSQGTIQGTCYVPDAEVTFEIANSSYYVEDASSVKASAQAFLDSKECLSANRATFSWARAIEFETDENGFITPDPSTYTQEVTISTKLKLKAGTFGYPQHNVGAVGGVARPKYQYSNANYAEWDKNFRYISEFGDMIIPEETSANALDITITEKRSQYTYYGEGAYIGDPEPALSYMAFGTSYQCAYADPVDIGFAYLMAGDVCMAATMVRYNENREDTEHVIFSPPVARMWPRYVEVLM